MYVMYVFVYLYVEYYFCIGEYILNIYILLAQEARGSCDRQRILSTSYILLKL